MMKIQQLRNATIILDLGQQRILVDPMLARKGTLPSLRIFAGRQRNPRSSCPNRPRRRWSPSPIA